ncbi:hypothetical protein B5M42_013740 [Paenibacillus athensensis]|uniref:Uncharacterized protein n=1 Tax=Paenibacillus athensensis TaxID=1967502 RepID=A0A4Y8PXJ2_9BACL|nr:hypothetical protein [Paenibacillus athensensis]MCD1259895.1 hypothetical protein [Paenibacillus athensensis]
MKKLTKLLVSSSLTLALLAGCSSGPSDEQAASPGPEQNQTQQEAVNLKLYTWLSEDTAHWSKILPEFTKEYPNIKVDVNILAAKSPVNKWPEGR